MRTVIAVIVALALAGILSQVEAKSRKHHRHYHHYHHYHGKVAPQVRGFVYRPGGHQWGYENEPLLYKNGPYGFYPFFDPRNFWERVQGGIATDNTSPSSF